MMKFSAILLGFSLLAAPAFAQSVIAGEYEGTATVHDQQVPVHLQIGKTGGRLSAALINGKEQSPASSVAFADGHLVVGFDYYARTLDGTLTDGKFTGSFGLLERGATRYPVTLEKTNGRAHILNQLMARPITGEWEVAVNSAKGETAWQLKIDPPAAGVTKAVIQRIDGDTGSLYGAYDKVEKAYRVSHFTAAGPAFYEFKPQADGTLLVSNLLRPEQTNLVARRPADARSAKLAAPTDPTQQTTLKDPNARFTFSYPDLSGKVISNTDPAFEGKVVIAAIGGSWCPNCHDEAPMLEELYKQFHDRGLEIVDLSFEEDDQAKDPTRLKAFIAKYGITYPVLLAGDPDTLNQKITIANNLNCWPTSFFIGRDGKVREIHAGFAGPANPVAHEALVHEVTELVEKLLAEPVPAHEASLR
jgi:peroxiredoxin